MDARTRSTPAGRFHQILEASFRLFANQGFHPTTIRQIAQEAKIADGTVYLYFENKEDILHSLLELLLKDLTDGLHKALKKSTDPIKQIDIAATYHFHQGLKKPSQLQFVLRELRCPERDMSRHLHEGFAKYIQSFQEIFRSCQELNLIRTDLHHSFLAHNLLGTIDYVLFLAAHAKGSEPPNLRDTIKAIWACIPIEKSA